MSELSAEQSAINDLIKPWEGYSRAAYWDNIGGCWTIGWGHTKGVEQHWVITDEQAEGFLVSDVAQAFENVKRFVQVTLTPRQFAALISFEYNTGAGADSGVYQSINAEKFAEALEFLMEWVHDGAGNVVAGLLNRRNAERRYFLGDGA